ncbi:hypothetical protein BJV77DRAFT_139967 [Russula vinacea]|nr:hypothetical protein BJV77DRAFT_139967 [Russula vinacea]
MQHLSATLAPLHRRTKIWTNRLAKFRDMRKRARWSRAWPALYSFGARINPVQVSLREPHLRADFITRPRHVSRIDRHPYKVTRRAKTCTTARALDCLLIPFRVEPLIPTVLQSAAPFRVLGNLVLMCIRPRLPRKSSLTACKDVHDCSRSQSVPQLVKKNSRSGRDDEGEHDALSWEEIPSPASFFFSWEENWGTQRPFLASLTLPHALAALATSHQRALYFDRSLHKVTSRAELCTTSCVQYSSPIPSSTAQLPIPFLQNSAYAAPLATYVRRSRDVDRLSPRFATCGSVLDRSRAWSALYLPGDRISLVKSPSECRVCART